MSRFQDVLLTIACVNLLWLCGLIFIQSSQSRVMGLMKNEVVPKLSSLEFKVDEAIAMVSLLNSDLFGSVPTEELFNFTAASTVMVSTNHSVGTGFITTLNNTPHVITCSHTAHQGQVGTSVLVTSRGATVKCNVTHSGWKGNEGAASDDWAVLSCHHLPGMFQSSLAFPASSSPPPSMPQRLLTLGYPLSSVDGDTFNRTEMVGSVLLTKQRYPSGNTYPSVVTTSTPVIAGNSGGPVVAPNMRDGTGRPELLGMVQANVNMREKIVYDKKSSACQTCEGTYTTHLFGVLITSRHLADALTKEGIL